jgi:hypothetical protein
MVGVPGTEERLALTEVEDRLRQLRGRFNLYSLQHNVYLFGTALALGAAVFIIAAFKLSSSFFAWIAWPLSLLLLGFLAYSVYRLQGEWANLVHTARRADQRMGLQERVSTLAAQLENGAIRKTPPSRLWPHLVADNTARLSDWEIKKVAPHRIPWTVLPFLAAVLITGLIASNALLSPVAQDDPFTLDNMQRVAQDLPQRVNTLIDEKTSLLPPASENSGDSVALNQSGSQHAADANRTDQQSQNGQQNQPNLQINPTDGEAHISSDNSATQTLASLPKEVQESIRRALKGLQIAPNPQTQQSLCDCWVSRLHPIHKPNSRTAARQMPRQRQASSTNPISLTSSHSTPVKRTIHTDSRTSPSRQKICPQANKLNPDRAAKPITVRVALVDRLAKPQLRAVGSSN